MSDAEKKKPLARLFPYAGRFKYLTYAAIALAGMSALIALLPFACIWLIMRDALAVMPDFAEAESIRAYGWLGVLSAIAAIFVYGCGSHVAAFRIARNLRVRAMRHIVSRRSGFSIRSASGRSAAW